MAGLRYFSLPCDPSDTVYFLRTLPFCHCEPLWAWQSSPRRCGRCPCCRWIAASRAVALLAMTGVRCGRGALRHGLPHRDFVPPRNDNVRGRTVTPVTRVFGLFYSRKFDDCPAGGADGNELVFAVGERALEILLDGFATGFYAPRTICLLVVEEPFDAGFVLGRTGRQGTASPQGRKG